MNDINFKLPLNGGNASQGENHIANVLQKVTRDLNTFYNRETKIGIFKGKRRRADFCFNYKGKTFLIEYDGIQHSTPIEEFGGEETFKDIKQRDHWENLTYCPSNNICLIRYKVFCNDNNQLNAQKKLLNFITPERLKKDIIKALSCKYVQNSISYGRPKLRIALDIDDTILNWTRAHESYFNCNLNDLTDSAITAQVAELKHNSQFWSTLDLLEKPDFVPELYCTKRINNKSFTLRSLQRQGLPTRPICQIASQAANKARYIRKRCDILIDDSWYNVQQSLKSGFPALLITRPRNRHIQTPYRINSLKYQEITKKYYELFR